MVKGCQRVREGESDQPWRTWFLGFWATPALELYIDKRIYIYIYIYYIISLYTSESQQVALCTVPKSLHQNFRPELSQAVQRLFWASDEFQVPSCQSFQIFEQKQCLYYFPDGYLTSLRPLSLCLSLPPPLSPNCKQTSCQHTSLTSCEHLCLHILCVGPNHQGLWASICMVPKVSCCIAPTPTMNHISDFNTVAEQWPPSLEGWGIVVTVTTTTRAHQWESGRLASK